MKSTLSERLREAMNGPPKVTGKELAAACGIKPPSVSGWLSGDTKTIEGKNLLAAARKLGVEPDWLANGKGPMRTTGHLHVAEPSASYSNWPFKKLKPHQWLQLTSAHQRLIEENAMAFFEIDAASKQPAPAKKIANG
ncbi:helix-turn-helix transcriptional regulator [Leptospira sp. 96542]|nr:helix-turn-helix transcriptional regulator [Leptospira sp. 96542]